MGAHIKQVYAPARRAIFSALEAVELFKEKELQVYGPDVLKAVDVPPTNLPAIEANELRLDNQTAFSTGINSAAD